MKHFHSMDAGRVYYRDEDEDGTSYPHKNGFVDQVTFQNHVFLPTAMPYIALPGYVAQRLNKLEAAMEDWTIKQHIAFLEQVAMYAETNEIRTKDVITMALLGNHITVMSGVVIWQVLP